MTHVLIPDHDRPGGLTTAADSPPHGATHPAGQIAVRRYDHRRLRVERLLDAVMRFAVRQRRQPAEGRR